MKINRITAALLAATLALTAVGCGKADADKNAASAADDSRPAETQAAETTVTEAQVTETTETAETEKSAESGTAEGKIRKIGFSEFCDHVDYKPTKEEALTLAELAVKQYNAVLERDGEAYYGTLGVKALFNDEDFEPQADELISYGAGSDLSARKAVFACYTGLMTEFIRLDNAGRFEELRGLWNEADYEAWLNKNAHIVAASADEFADLFKEYDPDSERYEEAYSSYFSNGYLSETMKNEPEAGIKTLSGDLTYKVMMIAGEEVGSKKYIMAKITAYDGDEELVTIKTLGFLYGSEAGVYTDDYDIAAYNAYTERLDELGQDDLSEAEKNILSGLAMHQYNAIVSRDAEEYLKTLNITGLFGSEDTAAEEEKQQSEARDTLGKCVRNAYMTPLRDKQKLDGGSFPASADVIDEEFIKQAVKAGKSKGDVMMNYVNELFFLNGEDGKCTNAPLSEATFDIEVRETEKVGDVVYADFILTFQAQGEEHTLWRCMAWLRGDEAGVYADMIDRTELEPYEYEQDDDSEQ